MKKETCVFCKIVKGEIKTNFVCESDNFVAFLDINPK
jgi:diadenosine tetraphosphate (Ap4A) HIT family hydrolase